MSVTIKDLEGVFWITPPRDHADYATKNHVHIVGQSDVMLCGTKKPRNAEEWDALAEEVMCKRCKAAMRKLGICLPHWKG